MQTLDRYITLRNIIIMALLLHYSLLLIMIHIEQSRAEGTRAQTVRWKT